MSRPVITIPLREAALCPEPTCAMVSNQARCPVCHSETLPIWRITERKQ